jgi:Ser/Thr protein kinase RdoA (MazF antagonist)
VPIDSLSHTTWDIGGQYVLKQYRKIDEALRSIRFSELLIIEGIPVSEYIRDKYNRLTSPDGLYCLMTKLPGKHIDLFENPSFASVTGRELARLHIALVNIESKLTLHDANLLDDWNNKFKPCIQGMVKCPPCQDTKRKNHSGPKNNKFVCRT